MEAPLQIPSVMGACPDLRGVRPPNIEEFARVYRAGLEEIGAQTILAQLERISAEEGGRPLVLLCYEDVLGDDWCHRQFAAEWIHERLGIKVRELERGMLPEVTPPRQSRLF